MKKIFLIISCIFLLSSCWYGWDRENDFVYYDSRYEAITMSREELKNATKILDNQPMTESSKIYIIGDYIFINDKRKGFHIFDNTNPENPVKKKFLNAPGATDISIRNNVLFLNQATDLVVLTMDFNNFSVIENKRIEGVFPVFLSPDGLLFRPEEGEVIVNFKEK